MTTRVVMIENDSDIVTVAPSGLLARRSKAGVRLTLVREQITPDTILIVPHRVLYAIPDGHELTPFCFAPVGGKKNKISRLIGKTKSLK